MVLSNKKRKELEKKCETLRDMVLDHDLHEESLLKKEIRKRLDKKEIEELAMQFILREATAVILDELKQNQDINEEDLISYGQII